MQAHRPPSNWKTRDGCSPPSSTQSEPMTRPVPSAPSSEEHLAKTEAAEGQESLNSDDSLVLQSCGRALAPRRSRRQLTPAQDYENLMKYLDLDYYPDYVTGTREAVHSNASYEPIARGRPIPPGRWSGFIPTRNYGHKTPSNNQENTPPLPAHGSTDNVSAKRARTDTGPSHHNR